MITRTDITRQVEASIDGSPDVETIDVDGIVDELVDQFGLIDVETIEHDAYWALVRRHDSSQNLTRGTT